jgi:hypothetical protein
MAVEKIVLTAYDVRTKEKNVPIENAVITKTARGAYMAQGNAKNGNKLTTLINETRAMEALRQGVAKCGWDENFVPPSHEKAGKEVHSTAADDNDGAEELKEASA